MGQLYFGSGQELAVERLGKTVLGEHARVEGVEHEATFRLWVLKVLERRHLTEAEDLLLLILPLAAGLLTLDLEGLHDILTGLFTHLQFHLLLSLRNEDDDLSRALSASAAETLDHSDRRSEAIVADD